MWSYILHFVVSRIPTKAVDKDTGIQDKRAIGIHNSWLKSNLFYPKENLNNIIIVLVCISIRYTNTYIHTDTQLNMSIYQILLSWLGEKVIVNDVLSVCRLSKNTYTI